MIDWRIIYALPKNTKRILNFLYDYQDGLYESIEEVTIGTVGRELGLNKSKMSYYLKPLKNLQLVNITKPLSALETSKKYTNDQILSVNADTVARSDIEEMIRNV